MKRISDIENFLARKVFNKKAEEANKKIREMVQQGEMVSPLSF